MKIKRLTAEEWILARQMYESRNDVGFADVAKEFGVSKAAIGKMAIKKGWQKVGALDSVNRAAHFRADGEVDGQVDGPENKAPLQSSIDIATDLRTKLIHNHRAEWRKHASLYKLEDIKESFQVGRSAKISAEMIAIRQRHERIAWGMDETGNGGGGGDPSKHEVIIINRSYT